MAAVVASHQSEIPADWTPNRVISCLAWGYPFMLLAAFIGPWLAAWALLGHMPRPSVDDPKDVLGFAFIACNLVLFFMPAGFFAAIYQAICLWYGRNSSSTQAMIGIMVLALLWVAVITLLRSDPLGIVNWWMD